MLSDWVSGDKERLIEVVLNGLEGTIDVSGKQYSGVMPALNTLSDNEIAQILSYIRLNFENSLSAARVKEVAKIRKNQDYQN